MNDDKKFKMNNFETYSFTRLVRTQSLEFFSILGKNNIRNFNEYWGGRSNEVLGYLAMYSDSRNNKLMNYIYLIEDENKDFKDIILHTKMFVNEMSIYLSTFNFNMGDDENFMIKKLVCIKKECLKKR